MYTQNIVYINVQIKKKALGKCDNKNNILLKLGWMWGNGFGLGIAGTEFLNVWISSVDGLNGWRFS